MSMHFPQKLLLARAGNTILNYLYLDALAVVLVFILATGATNGLNISGFLSPSNDIHETPGPAAAPVQQGLTPVMSAALDQVAQRYRISPAALQPIFETVQSVGREQRLDPLLIIAVISIESRFNPISQSPSGAQGLMQVIPRYHQDKVPKSSPAHPFLDPVANIRIGAQILQEAIRRQGGLMEGLQYYAGAADDEDRSYATKVLSEKLRLEQAARRRDVAGA